MSFNSDPNIIPHTGVFARIEDAGVLADAHRLEGALILLLIAVAATARKRYPKGTPSRKTTNKEMGDRESFILFLKDEMWRLVKGHSDVVYYQGRQRAIEEFLYVYLRCQLVHTATIPNDIQPLRSGDLLTLELPDGSRIGFSKLLLTRLNDIVWRAPENSFEAT